MGINSGFKGLIWKSVGHARLGEFYPGICLTTEEKARKKLSQGKKNINVRAHVKQESLTQINNPLIS